MQIYMEIFLGYDIMELKLSLQINWNAQEHMKAQ